MDEERRTQISTQSTKRLPSYGILENGVGNGAAASIRVADIGLENLPNVNGNGSGTPNATATASELDLVYKCRNAAF
ncbi:hypothetical protein DdX_04270 [Ditylenchus destructor]|uniref:Uncharacterized protein n=1 Tax=Ditylenchus destructor TaxID=166010 RepID=A0AAD4NCR5_9BILA|nr:hypothetical protein DdX_04270 [Ditylenchus destructor]